MTANLPMGAHKITGLSDGTLSTDAVSKGQMDTADTAITAAYIAADTANAAAIYGRNLLDNPKMEIAQRGTTYALTTATVFGSIDRWAATMITTAAGTWNQVAAPAQSRFKYMGRLGRNSGSALTTQLGLGQAVETSRSLQCAGQTVVLSFYAYAGANYSSTGNLMNVLLRSGTGTDQSTAALFASTWTGLTQLLDTTQAITTTLTRYTFTTTVPATATQIGVAFAFTPTGTAGADDNVYITGVQLEVVKTGQTTASAFEFVDYSTELNRCKRFHQRVTSCFVGYGSIGASVGTTTNFPITMYGVPTPAQVSNNYGTTQANVTTTTSTYVAFDNSSLLAYRVLTATGTGQFSELTSLTADL
jgi:hypothetical protein